MPTTVAGGAEPHLRRDDRGTGMANLDSTETELVLDYLSTCYGGDTPR
jgi:hypothetical protein